MKETRSFVFFVHSSLEFFPPPPFFLLKYFLHSGILLFALELYKNVVDEKVFALRCSESSSQKNAEHLMATFSLDRCLDVFVGSHFDPFLPTTRLFTSLFYCDWRNAKNVFSYLIEFTRRKTKTVKMRFSLTLILEISFIPLV